MKIVKIRAKQDWKLVVTSDDGLVGEFDVKPYLLYEAFECLANPNEFRKVSNGGYFVEWECGADSRRIPLKQNGR